MVQHRFFFRLLNKNFYFIEEDSKYYNFKKKLNRMIQNTIISPISVIDAFRLLEKK
mgnify:CR=1 FL=1